MRTFLAENNLFFLFIVIVWAIGSFFSWIKKQTEKSSKNRTRPQKDPSTYESPLTKTYYPPDLPSKLSTAEHSMTSSEHEKKVWKPRVKASEKKPSPISAPTNTPPQLWTKEFFKNAFIASEILQTPRWRRGRKI